MKTAKGGNAQKILRQAGSILKALESPALWAILILVIPAVARELQSPNRVNAAYQTTARVERVSQSNSPSLPLSKKGVASEQIIFEWMEDSQFPIASVMR